MNSNSLSFSNQEEFFRQGPIENPVKKTARGNNTFFYTILVLTGVILIWQLHEFLLIPQSKEEY